jgi:hypothetical protein
MPLQLNPVDGCADPGSVDVNDTGSSVYSIVKA